jgi:hypothetical protein
LKPFLKIDVFIIFLIFVYSFIVRFFLIGDGLPYTHYWDEPIIGSNSIVAFKDGTFNSGVYSYGNLLFYLNLLINYLYSILYISFDNNVIPFTSPFWEHFYSFKAQIITSKQSGFQWTLSHPIFYYLSRLLFVIFGVGSVCVTFLITKFITNDKWAGYFAALFLSSLPIHIKNSALILPNVPVGFFFLVATFYSLIFLEKRDNSSLIKALLFVGLSGATKLNGFLIALLPLLIIVFLYYKSLLKFSYLHILYFIFIPFLTFIVFSPFIFIESGLAIQQIKHIFNIYAFTGKENQVGDPGIYNIFYQLKQFYKYIGFYQFIFILIGIASCFFNKKLLIIFSTITIYILIFSLFKLNYHRNFILLYPLLSILFGSSIILYTKLNSFKYFNKIKFKELIFLLHLFCCFYAIYSSFNSSYITFIKKETRTIVFSELKSYKTNMLIIPNEFRIHNQDLNNIMFPYSKLNIENISCINKDDILIFPIDLKSRFDNEMNSIIPSEKKEKFQDIYEYITKRKYRLIKGKPVKLKIFNKNPGILIHQFDSNVCF